MKTKIAIIGGGPAGLSAAVAARKAGVEDILILERDEQLGESGDSCHGVQGTAARGFEYSGVSSGGNLFCRNRTALRQHRGTDAR